MTIEDTLGAILAAQHRIIELLEQRPQNSGIGQAKIDVENMAKKETPPKVSSQSYEGSVLTRDLVDTHLEAHAYATVRAEKMQMIGWERTLQMLEQGREVAEHSKTPEQSERHAGMREERVEPEWAKDDPAPFVADPQAEPTGTASVPDYDSEPTFAAKYVTAFDEPAAENPPTAHALEPTPFDDVPASAFAEVTPGTHLPRRR